MGKAGGIIATILFSIAAVPAQTRVKAVRADPRRGREVERGAPKRHEDVRPDDLRVLRLGPSTTYLKNGLSTDEVVRCLGRPDLLNELGVSFVIRTKSNYKVLVAGHWRRLDSLRSSVVRQSKAAGVWQGVVHGDRSAPRLPCAIARS